MSNNHNSIPAQLLAKMRKWKEDEDCEWVINWRGKQIKRVGKAFDSAIRKAGITRRFTPYSLRHSFATQALANGASIKAVCAVMGHSSPRMVLEVYQHINFEQVKNALQLLPIL